MRREDLHFLQSFLPYFLFFLLFAQITSRPLSIPNNRILGSLGRRDGESSEGVPVPCLSLALVSQLTHRCTPHTHTTKRKRGKSRKTALLLTAVPLAPWVGWVNFHQAAAESSIPRRLLVESTVRTALRDGLWG